MPGPSAQALDVNTKTKDEMDSKDLLIHELKLINFPQEELTSKFPEFIELTHKAMYLKPHENKMPSWGVILSEAIPEVSHELIDDYKDSYCNGTRSFAFKLVGSDQKNTISFTRKLDNIDLVNICKTNDRCTIQRIGNTLKLYYNGCIYVCENRSWKILATVHNELKKIQLHYRNVNETFMKDLLDFSFYELSLNKIGSTIIYWLDEKFESEYASGIEPMGLNFNTPYHRYLIKNYLSKNDGAVIINCNGDVIGGQAHLTFSDSSKQFIQIKDKGTRHNSSARFSFDNSKSIVITVSEDGPVSVFSEGANIAELSTVDPFFQNMHMHDLARDNGHYSEEDELETTCNRCGKKFYINVLTISGWREWESEGCCICGSELHSQKCFTINSRILKSTQ